MNPTDEAEMNRLAEVYGNSQAVQNDWSPRSHAADMSRKHYKSGYRAAFEKLSAELIGYKEALDRCQDVQRDLFNKLTQAKAELEEKTKALEGIETLHTPGDIKDWGAHECFAKCQSIAREVLAKYKGVK